MRTQLRRTSVFVFSSAVAATLVISTAVPRMALAQQAVERVEITGSSIRRIEGETALPVQIITREEIEKTGAQNVEQFLQGLGVAVQGNNNNVAATASGATSAGVSSVSLRGLGSQRTLVLIDGKRVSSGGNPTDSTSVDVNHIPASAIERIEVLKEGASAIYGSDAIGGVINFILRKDYVGGEVTATANLTEHPGGRGGGLNGLIGWGDKEQRYNATLVVDVRKEQAIYGRDREFAKTGIFPMWNNDTSSGNTFPANVFIPAPFGPTGEGTSRNPSAPACPGPYAINVGSPTTCRFDPAPLVSLIPETEQGSLFGNFRLTFTPQVQGYAQMGISHKEQRTIIQPVPISDQFALPLQHPLFADPRFMGFSTFTLRSSSPFYPTATVTAVTGGATPDVLVRYRSAATGNRDLTDISDQYRAVLGARGTVGKGWDYDASVMHIQTNLREKVNGGYPLLSKILPLLDTGLVNPFGANTPAVQAQVDATQFHGDAFKTKTGIDSAQAKVSTELGRLRGGPLALAVGGELRRELFDFDPSPEIQIGDISGYGGNFLPVDKTRKVGATFVEAVAPVIRALELTGAARYDSYEGVGHKISPKFGARFAPTRQVLFRGSIGKGFRAPSLSELYQPRTTGVTANGLNDPLRCPTTADPLDCQTQFPITLGGNPSLKPEISTNRTLGVVFEPTNNFSLGVDYWEVDLRDTIIFGVTPAAILADPAKFGFLVTRGAPSGGLPGRIIDIDQTNINFGETKVRGIDIDTRYRFPTGAAGVFTVGLNGTYITKYDVQNLDGSFFSVNAAVSPIVNGAGGVVPRWRHFAFVDWKLAPWNFTFAQQYQRRYRDIPGTLEDVNPASPDFTGPQAHPTVGDYIVYHFYASYQVKDNLRLTFGIRNLFDNTPPYTNAGGQNYFQSGYDPGYADPRGRTFILAGTYKFK
ncbi:MAG: TonB-dependent receptor [Burkholderiales bacterium]